jgi:hypothetical protein
MGTAGGQGWTRSDSSLGVAAFPTSIDRSLRLRATEPGRPTWGCRSFTPTTNPFVVTVDLLLETPGADALEGRSGLVSLGRGTTRSPMLVSSSGGRFAYSSSSAVTRTAAVARADGWYTVRLEVDPARGTYGVNVARRGSQTPLAEALGVALPPTSRDPVNKICFWAPQDPATSAIYIDNVQLQPGP